MYVYKISLYIESDGEHSETFLADSVQSLLDAGLTLERVSNVEVKKLKRMPVGEK